MRYNRLQQNDLWNSDFFLHYRFQVIKSLGHGERIHFASYAFARFKGGL